MNAGARRRAVSSAVVLAVAAAAAVGAVAYRRAVARESWTVSAAADTAGASVAHRGWSVALSAAGPHGSRVTMARTDAATKPALSALAPFSHGASAGLPVSISLSAGTRPAHGATLRRTFPDPLPEGSRATLAYYDPAPAAWRLVPTRLSADRRTLTAVVGHFSIWDDIVYGVGWLLDTRVSPPGCDGPPPAWVRDTTFLDDQNAPARWCAGHDPAHPELLVVKVAVNRSYGVGVYPATKATWVYANDRDGGPDAFFTRLLADPQSFAPALRQMFGGRLVALGGQEVSFGFSESAVRAVGSRALLTVTPDAADAVAGLTYTMLTTALGDGGLGRAGTAVASVLAVAQCGSDFVDAYGRQDWSGMAGKAVKCLTSGAEDTAHLLAAGLVRAFPRTAPKTLGKLAGQVGGKLWQVWAAGEVFQVFTWVADRRLDPSAFEFHAFGTVAAAPRSTPPPSVPTRPAVTGIAVGNVFDSHCVVAWPTAPSYTSTGVSMTMSCTGVPMSRYLFTRVIYDDTAFTISPSTGRVHVHGRVVDVARSGLGFSELVVQADHIDLP